MRVRPRLASLAGDAEHQPNLVQEHTTEEVILFCYEEQDPNSGPPTPNAALSFHRLKRQFRDLQD